MLDFITDIDIRVAAFFESLRNPFLNAFFQIITHLGDFGGIWILAALAMLIFMKKRGKPVCCAFGMLISSIAVNVILKPLIARARPETIIPGFVSLIPTPLDGSFPSGHTSFAFAAAFGISLTLGKKYAVPAYALAALIMISRMWVGVHFLSDCIGGAIIGTISAAAGWLILRQIIKTLYKGDRNERT